VAGSGPRTDAVGDGAVLRDGGGEGGVELHEVRFGALELPGSRELDELGGGGGRDTDGTELGGAAFQGVGGALELVQVAGLNAVRDALDEVRGVDREQRRELDENADAGLRERAELLEHGEVQEGRSRVAREALGLRFVPAPDASERRRVVAATSRRLEAVHERHPAVHQHEVVARAAERSQQGLARDGAALDE